MKYFKKELFKVYKFINFFLFILAYILYDLFTYSIGQYIILYYHLYKNLISYRY